MWHVELEPLCRGMNSRGIFVKVWCCLHELFVGVKLAVHTQSTRIAQSTRTAAHPRIPSAHLLLVQKTTRSHSPICGCKAMQIAELVAADLSHHRVLASVRLLSCFKGLDALQHSR